MIAIKRDGATVAVVEPDESSAQLREASGMDALRLSFELPHYRDLLPGDTAEFRGEVYHVTVPPTVRKEQGRHYSYRIDMEGGQHWLGRARYRQANPQGLYHANPFHLNGTAADMMALLIANMRRAFPEGGWELGQVAGTGLKNLHFDGASCLSAINDIAAAHGTEWHVEGRTVHLYPRQRATGLVLRQGRGQGLTAIEAGPADGANPVTRLYAYGGARNLPRNYRNGRQRLAIGAVPYIQSGEAAAQGVWEDDWTDESIYPTDPGTVTAADPADPLKFADAALPFDLNARLAPGLSPKVSFRTGQLAGYELEVASFDSATKTFRLKKHAGETSLDIPSELFRPAMGDEYSLHDVRMPPEFVELAEQRLEQAAHGHMDERGAGGMAYRITCSPLWFREKAITLRIGDSVRLMDDEMGIDVSKRVVKLTRNVRDPYAVTAELADRPKKNPLLELLGRGRGSGAKS